MDRKELKEIIVAVIDRMKKTAPAPACGLFWADNPEEPPTTIYAVGEEDATTIYGVGEEDVG
jgi:hypothetical protein